MASRKAVSTPTSRPTATAAHETARSPWAGNPPHPDAARDRLIAAASACIARDGLAATSIASVATEAGVSRPTVYRYFDDRDALVNVALHAAADQLRTTVIEHIERLPNAADMVVEAVVLAVTEIPHDPVLHAIWNSAALDASVVVDFTDATSIAWVRDCLAIAVDAAGWSQRDTDEAIEMILRMVLSLLITPAPHRQPRDLRAFLRRRLLPGIGL